MIQCEKCQLYVAALPIHKCPTDKEHQKIEAIAEAISKAELAWGLQANQDVLKCTRYEYLAKAVIKMMKEFK